MIIIVVCMKKMEILSRTFLCDTHVREHLSTKIETNKFVPIRISSDCSYDKWWCLQIVPIFWREETGTIPFHLSLNFS